MSKTEPDSEAPRVGLEPLEEPTDHYRLVVNGEVVSASVLLTTDEVDELVASIHEAVGIAVTGGPADE